MKTAVLLALLVAPGFSLAAGQCDIAGEAPPGSGKAGKHACVNVGDVKSCKAMAEVFGSQGWLKTHPPKYTANATCKTPVDPFASPSAPPGGVPGPSSGK